MQIDALNERFGIAGAVQVAPGNGGLAKISISTTEAAAEIYLYGAQVMSWRPVGAEEVIFVSGQSRWEKGRAVRGGIPVCFPWFRGKAGDPAAPAHGFVRTREWSLEDVSLEEDGSVTVECATESDEESRRWWPHEFRLLHRITVGKTLRLELAATNTGRSRLRMEEALHTYFRVGDVERVEVSGLDGVRYLDNTDGNREKTQAGALRLDRSTDNAYMHAGGAVEIVDPVLGRSLRTEKENSGTTIVWNPWQQGAAKLADLGDEEWHPMICVEGGNILGDAVWLDPGETHGMRVTLSVAAQQTAADPTLEP